MKVSKLKRIFKKLTINRWNANRKWNKFQFKINNRTKIIFKFKKILQNI